MKQAFMTSVIFVGVMFMIMAGTSAWAVPVYFSSSAEVGGCLATGSALLDYVLSDHILTITIDNTSPLTDSEGNSNSPAITGIGFNDADDDVPATLLSVQGDPGYGSQDLITGSWELDGSRNLQGGKGGNTLDFVVKTGNGVQCGFINPLANAATGSNLYVTTAVLSILFDGDPGDIFNWYLRFQNLGQGGEGSLNNVAAAPVPEPATIILLGVGLFGAAVYRKKKP